MQQQWEKFLDYLHVDSTIKSQLDSIELVKAKVDSQDNLLVELIAPKAIDVLYIVHLREKATSHYPYPVIWKITVQDETSFSNILLHTYFQDFAKLNLDATNGLNTLVKTKIELKNQKIEFHTFSKVHSITLATQLPKIQKYFLSLGCPFESIIIEDTDEATAQQLIDEEENKIQEKIRATVIQPVEVLPTSDFPKAKKFYKDKPVTISLSELEEDSQRVTFSGRIFEIEPISTRSNTIYNILLTDDQSSVKMKVFEGKRYAKEFLTKLVPDMWLTVTGSMEVDSFSRETVFSPTTMEIIEVDEERKDTAPEKRVELHLHTNMSALDAVTSAEKYVDQAIKWGHSAIAITDHGVVQAFPYAQNAAKGKPIKIIYGLEAYMIDDQLRPAIQPSPRSLEEATYVIFDIETTGLSNRHDEIIEFGAVKVHQHLEVSRLQLFVRPNRAISAFSTQLTGITNAMVANAPTIDEVLPRIVEFLGDSVLVAHNANFDVDFINAVLDARGKPMLTNPVIDTVPLAKMLLPKLKSYSLGGVSRYYQINYDEDNAHRADYDANILWQIFDPMITDAISRFKITTHQELNQIPVKDYHKFIYPYHVTLYATNQKGLKNLYKIVSISHTEYIHETPLIPRHIINQHREGLLVGSACINGEIFDLAQIKSEKALIKGMQFYDFIEIQPLGNYSFKIPTEKIESMEKIKQIVLDIVDAAKKAQKRVVATGDVHYLNPRDKIFRDVYIYAQASGSRRHPMYDFKKRIKEYPDQYFRTTSEMLQEMSFLGDPIAFEIVVTNTQWVANQMEVLTPIPTHLSTPHIDGVEEEIENACYQRAYELYGNPLPDLIDKRIKKELHSIQSNKFSVIYSIARKLVLHSLSEGYLVGSRGSVGSSLVATLTGITEVNPLPPHYLCRNCTFSEFVDETQVGSGYDLPDKVCPRCGSMMQGEGHNIPFETFLGIKGDKVPDIDLNFSGDYQARAHEYTKELLGADNVFRAGIISTVKDKTAFGYVRNYFEEVGKFNVRNSEIKRLAAGISNVRRTTGQHPGGIVVIPADKDVHDFTPIQYPADEVNATWITTHYEFKQLHDSILKLDILGHVDPTALRLLQDITGIDPVTLPMNDPKVLSLFYSTEELGLTNDQAQNITGSSGIPEFGTGNAKQILDVARPRKYSELVQVSGLSHGTNVWRGNSENLISSKTSDLMHVIGCRDDIMVYLVQRNMEPTVAFKIMESVRKGNGLTDEQAKLMTEHKVPDWYINSCKQIKYLFPKAHAAAYVIMALRVAWYKIYRPLHYYAVFFSVRCDTYDLETMLAGKKTIRENFLKLTERIQRKDNTLTNKEKDLFMVLEVALEMAERGFQFSPINLLKSDAKYFVVDDETNTIIPPFSSIDGLGESAAQTVVKARQEKPFISYEDLVKRTSLNQTHIKTLEKMGVLKQLQEEDQLSLSLF